VVVVVSPKCSYFPVNLLDVIHQKVVILLTMNVVNHIFVVECHDVAYQGVEMSF